MNLSEMLPLHIFPQQVLAESVFTTVWLGALVIIFFNQRLGWSLSGIVVPGYLTPLLFLKPMSVVIIVCEAILTYGLAQLVWGFCASLGWWHRAFGRDRFFAIILMSILVRLGCDGWLLPELSQRLHEAGIISGSLVGQMHSFGLIIIALMVNSFWKPGLVRGLGQLGIILLFTFLLARLLLMPATNFTLSNVAYLYEDMAANIAGSPKAYLLLLCTAWLASRYNLQYGWEYSGIMVPALMALLWYQPMAILFSIWEALVIFVFASILLRLPPFNATTMEGGRKLLFFFNISLGYKMVVGHLMPDPFQALDAFGFGYMLSTLLALKMHQKAMPIFITRTTLQVSLMAALAANIMGYGLKQLQILPHQSANQQARKHTSKRMDRVLSTELALQKDQPLHQLSEMDRNTFARALDQLGTGDETREQAMETLKTLGFEAVLKESQYYLIRPSTPAATGVFVLNTKARGNLLLTLQGPFSRTYGVDAAWQLGRLLGARLWTFGNEHQGQIPPLLHACQQMLAPESTLLLRTKGESDGSRVFVKTSLPLGFDLNKLDTRLEDLAISWTAPTRPSPAHNLAKAGFAELHLDKRGQRALALSQKRGKKKVFRKVSDHLNVRLLERKVHMAAPISNAYTQPQANELHFFDDEVLSPLQELVYSRPETTPTAELRQIAFAASQFGYHLTRLRDTVWGGRFLILSEKDPLERNWGTYVWNLDWQAPMHVQVPKPLLETGTLGLGLQLFRETRATSLAFPGAHPRANTDGSADVTHPQGIRSLFNLHHQVVMRRADSEMVQIRAASEGEGNQVWIHQTSTRATQGDHDPVEQWLEEHHMEPMGLKGQAAAAHLEAGFLPQVRYVAQMTSASMRVLWFSPQVREPYALKNDSDGMKQRFASLGIPHSQWDLTSWLEKRRAIIPANQATIQSLKHFLNYGDMRALVGLKEQGFRLRLISDKATLQPWLMLQDQERKLILVARLQAEGAQHIAVLDSRERAGQAHLNRADLIYWRNP